MPLIEVDLLNPTAASEAKKHKLKRLVPTPNSYFMDIRCPHCSHSTIAFSHAKVEVRCPKCSLILGNPSGGKLTLTQGCKMRIKK